MAVAAAGERPAPLWSLGFRPFFLLAGLWAPLALALWIVVFLGGGALPSRFDPLTWHVHAMLFGFVLAAAAGFLTTAIATWTGRPPIQGPPLAALVILWLLGRMASLVSAWLPLWLAGALDLAFPCALCVFAAREIIAARNRRNFMMPLPIGLLVIADLLMYLQLAGVRVPPGLGWRLGLAAVITLISVVAGRIVPAFTRNWLAGRGVAALPSDHGLLDRLALAALHAGLLVWAFFPTRLAGAALLIVAAALNLWRLGRWCGWRTRAEPLLLVLHVGYAWVACGAGLLGASILTPAIPIAAAIHALTAGAIGTMILAVMTRVTRGHTGRPLQADGVTTLIYLTITLAAVTRVVAAFGTAYGVILLDCAAALWIAAFLLFLAVYGPMLVRPRRAAGL